MSASSPRDELTAIARSFADPDGVRAVQRGYLRFFPGGRVLDLGCGRGLFLDLLRERGIDSLGVDASATAVEACRARGHEVVTADASEALDGLAARGEQFAGVFLSHVVEHLQPADAQALLHAAARCLAPGGRLVVVTPNPKNLVVLSEFFWLDPTHLRPYPRALLERMGGAAGLAVIASFDDPATVPRRPALRRVLARLRSALSGADRSGPLDAVVVFESR